MKIALCNEVLRDMDFPSQCAYAAALGYDAIELAPFTLSDEPHLLSTKERAAVRRAASDAGVEIISLHWLLVAPEGLSINTPDDAVRARTVDVMRRLIGLCADLGGSVLVHGSPAARQIPDGEDAKPYRQRARDTFAAIAEDAEAAGMIYCIEPLAARETNFLNRLNDAAAIIDAIGSPAIRTMIDTCSAGVTESLPLPDLIARWIPTGLIGHIQVNDTNHKGPGQGLIHFAPIFKTLLDVGYEGAVAVEPFIYEPDGRAASARAIGYIRGILETLAAPETAR